MLCLEITGHNARVRHCEGVVAWFISKYLPRHKLDITINNRGLLREGVFGWCSAESGSRPREFEIELHNRMDVELYTRTLLHELWHVYQHVTGNLKEMRGKTLWKGIDHSDTDYSDQPWEIEAEEMEEILYNLYTA
ncbi:hypothetical protein SynMITS9220M01_037 [Synechococcus phage SynMITS9220M01]|nr:hypothetical protein SynMITS9220M01_037 [Synechococcus phage SynMITS9220M01]